MPAPFQKAPTARWKVPFRCWRCRGGSLAVVAGSAFLVLSSTTKRPFSRRSVLVYDIRRRFTVMTPSTMFSVDAVRRLRRCASATKFLTNGVKELGRVVVEPRGAVGRYWTIAFLTTFDSRSCFAPWVTQGRLKRGILVWLYNGPITLFIDKTFFQSRFEFTQFTNRNATR
jgi:hypothetical protein